MSTSYNVKLYLAEGTYTKTVTYFGQYEIGNLDMFPNAYTFAMYLLDFEQFKNKTDHYSHVYDT
ncbi:hypothetical protein GGI00_006003, partial [Coemansia sp. RSA 2681]